MWVLTRTLYAARGQMTCWMAAVWKGAVVAACCWGRRRRLLGRGPLVVELDDRLHEEDVW